MVRMISGALVTLYHKQYKLPWGVYLISFFCTLLLLFDLAFCYGRNENHYFLSIFSHGNFEHLCGNLLVLAFVGPRVERGVGFVKFLLIFIAGGLVGGFSEIYIHPIYQVLGASAGVSTIIALAPFFASSRPQKYYYLFVSILYLLMAVRGSLASILVPLGIAYLAHFAGYATGLFIGLLIFSSDSKNCKQLVQR